MGSPQGIVFGQRAPSLSFTPDDVLGDTSPVIVRGRNRRSVATPVQTPTTAAELYQQHYVDSTHVPNPADQRLELERARDLNSHIAQHHKDRMLTRQLVAGAALAEGLGELDARDPHYRVKAAKLFVQYPEGANSPAAEAVSKMKQAEFAAVQTAQANRRQAVFTATLQKRIEPLLSSEHVPFELKNQLMNQDGTFNADAVKNAEALHSANGGKSGDEFYSALLKNHGLNKADLDSVVADPSLVSYFGPLNAKHPDKGFGKVSSDTVLGQEDKYRAMATLPNGGTPLNLPLNVFEALVNTHKNLSRIGAPAGAAAPTPEQEQEFRDRATMEASLATVGATPASAEPPGYRAWKTAGGTATGLRATSPNDEFSRLLIAKVAKGPAPVATPSALPPPLVAVTPQQAAGNYTAPDYIAADPVTPREQAGFDADAEE
ncbi:MAG: hypothetical protein QOI07_2605 [Verrucomicrobiota bacterium]|jgi:hypothetical protein